MNDPHVVALHYVVKPGDGITYDNPSPLIVQQTAFELELRDDRAVATMRVHCATQDEACSVLTPFLRAWELDSALSGGGKPLLQFRFQRSEIIDRNPPPVGTVQVAAGSVRLTGHAVVVGIGQAVRHQYPAPPAIRLNADMETLWFRYSLYKEGRDTLTGMAYFCLTFFEALGGGRNNAARMFGIATSVLNTLARLVSAVGDKATARKWAKSREDRPHTAQEVAWIEATVRALIRRVGEPAAAGAPLRQLTMADLPPLP